MLAKITSKNQITIPKKIIDKMPGIEHFDIEYENGVVVLRPVKIFNTNLNQIRSKIKKLGINENSVAEAIEWVKSKKSESF